MRPASVIINSNTCLKGWPCRGRMPSWVRRVRRYYDICFNIPRFAIKERVTQQFATWILLPVITKYVRPYFLIVGNWRVNFGRVDFFLFKFELLLNLSTPKTLWHAHDLVSPLRWWKSGGKFSKWQNILLSDITLSVYLTSKHTYFQWTQL